jgi:hypothetical protein
MTRHATIPTIAAMCATLVIVALCAPSNAGILTGGAPDPGFADLHFWLDASDASLQFNVSDQVTQWHDRKTGSSINLTPTGGPSAKITRVASGIGGQPSVRFDGTSELNLSAALSIATGASGHSAFLVARTDDASGKDTLMSTTTNRQFFRQENTQVIFYNGNSPWPVISSDTVTADRVRYVEFDTSLLYRTNGASLAVTNPGGLGSSGYSLTTLGGIPTGGCCADWDGDVAEFIVYDRFLSTAEENQVGYYLANKYGITTSYVPGTVIIDTSNGLQMNRVVSGNPSKVDTTIFSTYDDSVNNIQASYVTVTNVDLLAALEGALGPLTESQSYQINAATFFAGSVTDDYAQTGSVYTTSAYNPATINWNNQPETSAIPSGTWLSAGMVTGPTTSWDVFGGVDLINDTHLFWEPSNTANTLAYAVVANANLRLVLDAQIVPEPTTILIWSLLAGLGIGVRRRRRG